MRKEVAEGYVSAFNSQWPIGTPCILIHDLGEMHQVVTTSPAFIGGIYQGEATPMVQIETGIPEKKYPRGAWLLTRIIPINPAYE